MAQNYLAPGKHLTFTAPAAWTGGMGYNVGSIFGVALESVAQGQPGDLAVDGCWTLPSDGSAFTAGELVYWTGTQVTPTASSNQKIGVALQALAAGGSAVAVRLNGAF